MSTADVEAPEGAAARRPWRATAGAGLVAFVATYLTVLGCVALPLYGWAQATEPVAGTRRPLVHQGLVAAPWLALAAAVLVAVAVARWWRTGGTLPEPTPFEEIR